MANNYDDIMDILSEQLDNIMSADDLNLQRAMVAARVADATVRNAATKFAYQKAQGSPISVAYFEERRETRKK